MAVIASALDGRGELDAARRWAMSGGWTSTPRTGCGRGRGGVYRTMAGPCDNGADDAAPISPATGWRSGPAARRPALRGRRGRGGGAGGRTGHLPRHLPGAAGSDGGGKTTSFVLAAQVAQAMAGTPVQVTCSSEE